MSNEAQEALDQVEVGTCTRCGQEMLRTADDCWHPYTIERACPPEVSLFDQMPQPEWGRSFRPGREFFEPQRLGGVS